MRTMVKARCEATLASRMTLPFAYSKDTTDRDLRKSGMRVILKAKGTEANNFVSQQRFCSVKSSKEIFTKLGLAAALSVEKPALTPTQILVEDQIKAIHDQYQPQTLR